MPARLQLVASGREFGQGAPSGADPLRTIQGAGNAAPVKILSDQTHHPVGRNRVGGESSQPLEDEGYSGLRSPPENCQAGNQV